MFNLGDFSMKKTLVALAAFAAVSAFAQSTVTLYGVADVSFGSYKEGPPGASAQIRVNDGTTAGLSGSRIGFRVNEDLGGGMNAFATIEMGANLDTGASAQGGLAFGRQSFVGLGGGFGKVSLGRLYSAYDDLRGATDAFGHSSFSPSLLGWGNNTAGVVGDGGNYSGRVNNQIKYNTPNFGGLSGAVTYGFGENKTPTVGAGKVLGFHVLYANGPLTAGLAYQSEKATAASAAQKFTLLAGGYDFGAFKLNAGLNTDSGAAKAKELQISGTVPVGAFSLTAGLARSKGSNDGADTSVALQGVYALSKRTNWYAGLRNGKSKGTGDTNKISHIATGIRHTF
jgi:predicted porin